MIVDFHPMSIQQIIYLLMAGVMASGGQFSVTSAYSYAPAKEISIFDYSQVLFVGFFGFVLYGEIPDTYSFIGYLIIFVTAYMMYVYGKRKI
ncbi:EamA family transporter [Enterococcus cecorum]